MEIADIVADIVTSSVNVRGYFVMNINKEHIGLSDSADVALTDAQKEAVIDQLKKKKYRITKQRRILLDIILDGECSSSKEIYYRAAKVDSGIGAATVYRMINTLEEIGVINRNCFYSINKDYTV